MRLRLGRYIKFQMLFLEKTSSGSLHNADHLTVEQNGPQINSDFSHLKGLDAVNAELKYLVSDEGKAEKARKKAEAASKKEAKN